MSRFEKATYCRVPNKQHSRKRKTIKTKKISGCWNLERRRDEQVEHKGFLGQGNFLYTIMVDMSLYIC